MQSALWQLTINLIFRISNLLKLVWIIYSFPGLYKGIGRHYSVCVSWSVWMSIIVLWKRMEDNGFIRKHQNELNFCRSTKKMECWAIPRCFNKFSLFKYINCGKIFSMTSGNSLQLVFHPIVLRIVYDDCDCQRW